MTSLTTTNIWPPLTMAVYMHVQYVWKMLSLVLSFDVQWKHVILGFYFEQNSKLCFLNTVISFLAFKIYKYKMYCRLQNKVEQEPM